MSASAQTSSRDDGAVILADGAIVCKDSVLEGDVRIGKGTVVNPKCVIRAEKGPIEIGEVGFFFLLPRVSLFGAVIVRA